jgi:nucleoside-diphosphate-sugar epimerase
MRVVVTGAGGFIGWHLVDSLSRRGDIVQAWVHSVHPEDWQRSVEIAAVDITDYQAVSSHLGSFAPDIIFHLAAQSLPNQSWQNPARTYEVNVIGAINLLEAVRHLPKIAKVLVAGSSAEYADPIDGQPITEDASTQPNSPYGSSKLAADQLVQLYVRRYNLDLVRFRPFFLVGPRKTGDVSSDFARRIVAIERGAEPVMRVGSLDVVRDIIDVRDGVSGMLCVAERGRRGEVYNICGGKGVRIGEILESYRRRAKVPFSISSDSALHRSLEQMIKVGDPHKLRALGWKPMFELETTFQSILDYWRQSID